MEDIYQATGYAVIIFLLSSAQALGLRLEFWRASDVAPALDAQIRKREIARIDFLHTAAFLAVLGVGIGGFRDSGVGKLLVILIWLLWCVGLYLQHSTTPPKNVLARRYVVGQQILVLMLIVALLGIVYLAVETPLGAR